MPDTLEPALKAALAPCPFCGGPASIIPSHDSRRIACRNKDCFGPETSFFGLEAEAIAAWNRRATPQAEIDRLRDALREIIDKPRDAGSTYPQLFIDVMLELRALLHPETPNGGSNV